MIGAGRARRRGLWSWALFDWAAQAFAMVQTFVFAAYFTRRIAADADTGATQWSLTIGAAGLVVAVLGPVLGARADRSGRRKPWLASFTGLSVAATAAIVTLRPGTESVAPALALLALAVIGVQTATVFYNAMLADLAPRRRFGIWSGRGWALGYAGGVLCMGSVYLLFLADEALLPVPRERALAVRTSFLFVAAWILVFTLPLLRFTPDRRRRRPASGMRGLRPALRAVRAEPGLLRFLVGRALYMDGLSTVFAVGGVYAAGTFAMDEQEILLFGVALNLSAGVGALLFAPLDDRRGSRATILAALTGLFVCATALLLVQERAGLWVAGLLFGIFVGPVQSASRSWLSHVAPRPLRARLFGLYALADRSTAFLGPLVVGVLTAASGSQRVGLVIVPVLFALGLWALHGVPEARAPAAQRRVV
jgi:UMF1 family MFS transporter